MKRKALFAIFIIMVATIWIQSILPSQISAQESGWFIRYLFSPIAKYIGLDSVPEIVVRKLAHIIEYCTLGLLALLWKRKAIYAFQICFLVAFLDETLQMLSKRGATVLDVWIDICGASIGIGLFLILLKKRRDLN